MVTETPDDELDTTARIARDLIRFDTTNYGGGKSNGDDAQRKRANGDDADRRAANGDYARLVVVEGEKSHRPDPK